MKYKELSEKIAVLMKTRHKDDLVSAIDTELTLFALEQAEIGFRIGKINAETTAEIAKRKLDKESGKVK